MGHPFSPWLQHIPSFHAFHCFSAWQPNHIAVIFYCCGYDRLRSCLLVTGALQFSLTPSKTHHVLPSPWQVSGLPDLSRTPCNHARQGYQHVVPLGGSTNAPVSYTVIKLHNPSTRSYGTDIILRTLLWPGETSLLSHFSYHSKGNLRGSCVRETRLYTTSATRKPQEYNQACMRREIITLCNAQCLN